MDNNNNDLSLTNILYLLCFVTFLWMMIEWLGFMIKII